MSSDSTEAIKVGDIKDVRARKALPALCSDYRDLQDNIAQLQRLKEELIEQINAHCERARVTKVKGDGWSLFQVPGRKSIVKEELLKRGVSIEVIEAAEKQGKSFWQVRGVKE